MKLAFFKTSYTLSVLIVFFSSISSIFAGVDQNGMKTTPDIFTKFCKQSELKEIYAGIKDLSKLESTNQNTWLVYSDRDNNKLYQTSALMNSTNETLGFMQELHVKEVRKNKLLVYKEENKKFIELGWIKAENLILSNYAAVLNNELITRKAMILLTISNLDPKKMARYQDELDNKYFYNSPTRAPVYRNGKSAKTLQIYFVLKETQSMILLSVTDKLASGKKRDSETLKVNVTGWIPKLNVTNWDHRVCYEPNYGSFAKEAYQGKNVPVFQDYSHTNTFISSPDEANTKTIIKNIEIEENRQDPYIMRMPVLINKGLNIKQVAVIASLEKGPEQEQELAALKKRLISLSEKINNVDIMFVVDATGSMKKYFASIVSSIRKIIGSREIADINYRFGLSIYRDYPDGDEMFEIVPLTSDTSRVIRKLISTDCSSKGKTDAEAVYQGLIKGINQAGFNRNNSNIVVHIGDAANHNPDSKYTFDQVVSKFIEKNINLIAFQVNQPDAPTYRKFNWETQDILEKIAQKNTTGESSFLLEKLKQENTYGLVYENKDNEGLFRSFGRFTYAIKNTKMSTNILEQSIEDATKTYFKKVNKEINIINDAIGGNGRNTNDGSGLDSKKSLFTPAFTEYLKNKGFSDSQIGIFTESDISAKGFTSKIYYSANEDCFYPVVFLTYAERERIREILGKLSSAKLSGSQKKVSFKNAIVEQTKNMLGTSEEALLDRTLNQVWRLMLGVDFTGNYEIAKKKLRNLDKLSDDEFDSVFGSFSLQANKFRNDSHISSRYKRNGQYFYWIPLSEFPGTSDE